ncbi:MAG: FAD-binding domain-containing protein [Steroidobacteraceae bacterium]
MITQIVWFKRDLRLEDHAPLAAAAASGPVLALYVIEPDLWTQPDSSSRHWQFIRETLIDLSQSLQSYGGELCIRSGEITHVFELFRQTLGDFELHSHEETGNAWSYARDLRLADWCRTRGIKWNEYPANGVIRRLGDRDRWAAKRNARMQKALVTLPNTISFAPLDSRIHLEPLPEVSDPRFGPSTPRVQRGGRSEALKVLDSFLSDRSERYMTTISKPGVSARHCSRLSTHIAYGTLSVREIEKALEKRIDHLEGIGDPSSLRWARQLQAFGSRLAWRCHFAQKLEQQPSIETHCMHPAFEGMRENDFRQDWFDAWCEGRTGYPLVDACMRSLHANGWITFRMRAMLVAFASYHLWLDWRRTAPFMARLFTDYEPGIHYSQFQMQSGVTGINATRIYNPVKQSYDHDPEGRFIRRYLPELKGVPEEFIHEPWLMSSPPTSYPSPLVDHEAAARLAKQRMTAYRRGEDFREQAAEVFRKLGSRNRPNERRAKKPKATPAEPLPQLKLNL